MTTLPLLGHADPERIFAWSGRGPTRTGNFLGAVAALAERLPAGGHLLNLCQDRYHFAVGFAAGLIRGKLSLQPASTSVETLRALTADYPDLLCLSDKEIKEVASLGLPRLEFPDIDSQHWRETVPAIPAERPAVCLFTSGSTGRPTPHRKTWGKLVRNGQSEAQRLGLLERTHSIVGTVPVQHSYGFESTFLQALGSGSPFWSGQPFYPQDIAAALAAVPRPRLLVTTPFHLSALLTAAIDLPDIDMLLSATAPLPAELAAAAEARCRAPLLEIYGATESGQVASRRTTADPAWQLLAGIELSQDGTATDAVTWVRGDHVEGRIALSDRIELLADRRFLLHGRHADMVNIAGKRTSLAFLDRQLATLPGVVDAAFYLPDEDPANTVTRPCAFAVAPGLDSRQLRKALRERIDAVFLPRPLILVDRLPRNATGKLPRAALAELYREHRQRREPADD